MTEERRKKVIDTCRAAVKEEFRKLRSIDDISALGGLRRAVASRLPDLTDAEYCEAEYVVITELKGDADCYSTLASVAERHGQWRGESARQMAERAAEAGDVEAIALLSKLIKATLVHPTLGVRRAASLVGATEKPSRDDDWALGRR